jgi:hypothetical protein
VNREKTIIAANKITFWWLDIMYRPGSNYVNKVLKRKFESMCENRC